jgi:hypothetical protein
MKKNFLVLLLSVYSIVITGQAPFPGSDDIKQFMASTTCVVMEDDAMSAYNAYIKQAMNESWKITPFEFIKTAEFNVRRSDPAFSFIVLTGTN